MFVNKKKHHFIFLFLLPAVFDNIINELSRIAGMYHINISAYLWSVLLILPL